MPYEIFLALRYVYSRRRRALLARAATVFAVIGIAFGVAALIVALSLSNGFQDEMRDKILSGTAHISLMRKDGAPMPDWRELIQRLKLVQGVREASGTTYTGALLNHGRLPSYAILRGVDIESQQAAEEVKQTIIAGSIDDLVRESPKSKVQSPKSENEDSRFKIQNPKSKIQSCLIGAELAERAGLRIGDEIEIVAADREPMTDELIPIFLKLRVDGIFRTGLYEYDSAWIYVSLAVASKFTGQEQVAASIISIEIDDIYKSKEIASKLYQQLGNAYLTLDWQEANRPLFAALALERRVGLIIISLLVMLAAFNITTTLVLIVVERRNDIAILAAMGARPKSIMFIFMLEGAFLGLIGASTGVALGLILCYLGQRYNLVSLPADVYSIGGVPFHTRATDVLLAVLVAFVLSLIATIYPALIAARMRPAEALKG